MAEIAGQFLKTFDARWERCWIAEKDGQNVGSVFVVRQSAEVAKLRMLLVEPRARGLGIGARLVEECIRFARLKGYKKMTFGPTTSCTPPSTSTGSGLSAGRGGAHHSFGQKLVGQTWELEL